MLIKILDLLSIGKDTPIDAILPLGDCEIYPSTSPKELSARIADADVLILNKVRLNADAFAAAKNLKLVCVFATGYDNIDLDAAREHGVAVCNVPAYSTDSVALFTMATVLSLAARLGEYRAYVASGDYSASGVPNKLEPVYHEIAGMTWGIVGYGNIGRAVGKIAEAMGAKVIVYKRHPVEDAACVDLRTLCAQSDVITLHCPLNEQSRGMIGREEIARMKPDVILVNEARGAVLDEAAVAEAVLAKKIGAFGADIYSSEPFSEDHPFGKIAALPNVCLTPHAAWGSYEARARCIAIVAENVASFVAGGKKNRIV